MTAGEAARGRRHWGSLALAGGLLVLLLWHRWPTILHPKTPDAQPLGLFGTFWASGWAARHGLNPYVAYPPLTWSPHAFGKAGQPVLDLNLNPPAMLPLFSAWSRVAPVTGALAWQVISLLIVLGVAAAAIVRYQPERKQIWWLLTCGATILTFGLQQDYALLLLLAAIAWWMLEDGHDLAAAICLGVLVAIKPNVAPWPAVLILSGRRKLLVPLCATIAALWLIPVALYGARVYGWWLNAIGTDAHWIFPADVSIAGNFSRMGARAIGVVLSVVLLALLAVTARTGKPTLREASGMGLCAALLCAPLAWIQYLLLLAPLLMSEHWNRRQQVCLFCLWIHPSLIDPDVGEGHWSAFVRGLIYFIPLCVLFWEYARRPAAASFAKLSRARLNRRATRPLFSGLVLPTSATFVGWATFAAVTAMIGGMALSRAGRLYDWRAFYAAGDMLRHQPTHLFDLARQASRQDQIVCPMWRGVPFYHPAYEALLYAPFSLLSYRNSYFAYVSFNLLILLACYCLAPAARSAAIARMPRGLLLFCSFPVLMCILEGQNSLIFLLAMCLFWRALEAKRLRLAGVILGAALFKLPIVVIVAALLSLRLGRRFVAGFATSSIVVGLVCVAITGVTGARNWFYLLSSAGVASHYDHRAQVMVAVYPLAMPSLNGLLYASGGRWLSTSASLGIDVGLSLVVLAVGVVLVRRAQSEAAAFSAALCCALLLSPHLFLYDYAVLLLPALLLHGRLQAWFVGLYLGLPWLLFMLAGLDMFSLAAVLPLFLLAIVWIAERSRVAAAEPIGESILESAADGGV